MYIFVCVCNVGKESRDDGSERSVKVVTLPMASADNVCGTLMTYIDFDSPMGTDLYAKVPLYVCVCVPGGGRVWPVCVSVRWCIVWRTSRRSFVPERGQGKQHRGGQCGYRERIGVGEGGYQGGKRGWVTLEEAVPRRARAVPPPIEFLRAVLCKCFSSPLIQLRTTYLPIP